MQLRPQAKQTLLRGPPTLPLASQPVPLEQRATKKHHPQLETEMASATKKRRRAPSPVTRRAESPPAYDEALDQEIEVAARARAISDAVSVTATGRRRKGARSDASSSLRSSSSLSRTRRRLKAAQAELKMLKMKQELKELKAQLRR